MNSEIFEELKLNETAVIYAANWVDTFRFDSEAFMNIWNLHPEEYHTLRMYGKDVQTPRWQQSYGKSYNYTGSTNTALPILDELKLFLEWSQTNIDRRLNGFLINWYDGQKEHYIGAHRDDTRDLCEGSPIVTISLGEERVFRLRPYMQKGYKDITLHNGSVIVLPWNTNMEWTHEVPSFRKYKSKRISVTLRAYT